MANKRKQIRTRRPAPARRRGNGGDVWLYGIHAVRAALANPERKLHRLLVADADTETPENLAFKPEIVTREEISSLLPGGAVHQGYALLADPLPPAALEDFCTASKGRERAVAVMLDQVSDPRNVGAILRSAAVFGADAVILPDRHAAPASAVLAKAASGALESVKLIRVANMVRALKTLKSAEFWCAGLDAEAEVELADAGLAARSVLVMGAEGRGLRRLTRENCDLLVRIPSAGGLASLNVSNAASIALYELYRASKAAQGE